MSHENKFSFGSIGRSFRVNVDELSIQFLKILIFNFNEWEIIKKHRNSAHW